MRSSLWILVGALLLPIAGCSHRAQTAYAPPPPPIAAQQQYPRTAQAAVPSSDESPDSGVTEAPASQPIYTEVGMASWYGPPYDKRRGANGEIYDQNAVTAAHRTLPMGSLIRVTNLQTGQSAMMRITDRGPFVPDRVIDLSEGAAKTVGVWRPGIARVRIDVYEAPKPINQGGRWCVQIGAFPHEGTAKKLEEHLAREYESASVIEFTGPTGHWVRIRPENGDKSTAIAIVKNMRLAEGAAYLVRLD
ncbi:MAG TPA: septal ring lytic transglycosylase RlpA family protein [Silvibacterium sp.]|nr:septal ring lytic transglycosylase RlpA family protein [Silvibacterium sp.]